MEMTTFFELKIWIILLNLYLICVARIASGAKRYGMQDTHSVNTITIVFFRAKKTSFPSFWTNKTTMKRFLWSCGFWCYAPGHQFVSDKLYSNLLLFALDPFVCFCNWRTQRRREYFTDYFTFGVLLCFFVLGRLTNKTERHFFVCFLCWETSESKSSEFLEVVLCHDSMKVNVFGKKREGFLRQIGGLQFTVCPID